MTEPAENYPNPPFPAAMAPLPSERLAMDRLPSVVNSVVTGAIETCVVMSPGRGQAGAMVKAMSPDATVIQWYVDSFRAAQSTAIVAQGDIKIDVVCSSDLPEIAVDLAVLPVLKNGEAEMNRDLLQQAYQRLRVGGHLIAAVNAPRDKWLLTQMQSMFSKVHCHSDQDGWAYVGKKQGELKKVRSFDAEIEFLVDGRVMKTFSRPSVFSHRSIDTAARVMIREVAIPSGANVLELGCGNGAVAMAAAVRSVTGHAYAVDCNARAIECVTRAMDANEIRNMTPILNHDGVLPDVPPCDIALLNPPYYGDFAIAAHFIRTASAKLKPGGDVWVVTKQTDKYENQSWPGLVWHSVIQAQGYDLINYRKPVAS
ncbi:Ribosomal RNA small subunit methyltransferase C [Rubripirellula tenax]|uniref:Ribosomal RNA small subunit methyltransferase C n=1 Tax=Rubripirellula tenax TaxID=2528015 RepID=A0A5C6FFD3_9BACT|nr:methyltransferase [Rubripirellula tenax]TWU59452.1 Ribosomal RNA small subunit methyltransferase C [Rubripirellula tenax]